MISATITSFPSPPIRDQNLDAIDDAHELYFFGGNTSPFGDADGDGFSNLQESLEGSHSRNPASVPSALPMPLGIPPVKISHSEGNVTFAIKFPSLYGDRLYFLMKTPGGILSQPFVETADAATNRGAKAYSLTIPAPARRAFFRFRIALRL
ncbi:MAG: hypothetical protein ACJAVK_001377 [Akkermansiaceae bacterium]